MVAVVLLGLEYVNAPLDLAAAPPRRTAVGQWLAGEPTPGAVVHLPLGDDIENTPVMVQSLEHHRPIVNGYSGQRPAFFSALVENLADFPSPDALAAVRELDVRFVVAPSLVAGAGNARSPLVERARFHDGVIYEVRWTPEATAAVGELGGPPPPPPGKPVFAAGESATYDVHWDGGPVDLPAGVATVSVLDGAAEQRWTFEARADTASWLSRFLQAHDRFTTIADASLLPLEHRREIREGRHELNRTFLYDRAARNIRVGESRAAASASDALTLPLGRGRSPRRPDGAVLRADACTRARHYRECAHQRGGIEPCAAGCRRRRGNHRRPGTPHSDDSSRTPRDASHRTSAAALDDPLAERR